MHSYMHACAKAGRLPENMSVAEVCTMSRGTDPFSQAAIHSYVHVCI